MKNAQPHHKKTIVDILTRSFESNLSVNYIIKRRNDKISSIRSLMDYSFEMCMLFGDVFISENETACALVIYPDKKITTIKSILLDAKLILRCVGFKNVSRTLAREKLIRQVQPKEQMTYLWFIGVAPEDQHKGLGSDLLLSVINHSNDQKRIICLETSTVQNLPWYKKFGFKVYDERHLTYHLYFLRRDFEK